MVADRLLVVSYGTDGDEFGADTNVLRVAVGDGQNAADLALAAETGTVSVVGITGASEVSIPEITSRGSEPTTP